MCVCVFVYVCVRMCVCMHACIRACTLPLSFGKTCDSIQYQKTNMYVCVVCIYYVRTYVVGMKYSNRTYSLYTVYVVTFEGLIFHRDKSVRIFAV